MNPAVQQNNNNIAYEEHPNSRLIIHRHIGEPVGRGYNVVELFTSYNTTKKEYQVEIRRGIRTNNITKYTPIKDAAILVKEKDENYTFEHLKELHAANKDTINRQEVQHWGTLINK